jgi:hypothetical protein
MPIYEKWNVIQGDLLPTDRADIWEISLFLATILPKSDGRYLIRQEIKWSQGLLHAS